VWRAGYDFASLRGRSAMRSARRAHARLWHKHLVRPNTASSRVGRPRCLLALVCDRAWSSYSLCLSTATSSNCLQDRPRKTFCGRCDLLLHDGPTARMYASPEARSGRQRRSAVSGPHFRTQRGLSSGNRAVCEDRCSKR